MQAFLNIQVPTEATEAIETTDILVSTACGSDGNLASLPALLGSEQG